MADLVVSESPQFLDTLAKISLLRVFRKFIAYGRELAAEDKFGLLVVEPAFVEYAELIVLAGEIYGDKEGGVVAVEYVLQCNCLFDRTNLSSVFRLADACNLFYPLL